MAAVQFGSVGSKCVQVRSVGTARGIWNVPWKADVVTRLALGRVEPRNRTAVGFAPPQSEAEGVAPRMRFSGNTIRPLSLSFSASSQNHRAQLIGPRLFPLLSDRVARSALYNGHSGYSRRL